jgi:hypothetical protein
MGEVCLYHTIQLRIVTFAVALLSGRTSTGVSRRNPGEATARTNF